jgi:glycosyltransferase involved in cell wall biosynthesis
MVSIVILTKDEAGDLPLCLEAVAWCDDVHVVDSGSTDRTCEIAREHGAQVLARPFDSFARQRNWALANCALRHAWVLFLDADERATPAFAAGVRTAIQAAPVQVAGFYCCWKMMLDGRWLKWSDSFPKWQLRLLRRGRVQFVDVGHGQKEGGVDGRLDYVREPYLHYAFSKGWRHWVDRHNRYSDLEAIERGGAAIEWQTLFDRHASQRNKALKQVFSRVPGWPLLRFLHAYLLKAGFLDGRPGFDYAVMLGFYEFLIRIKIREFRRRRSP